MTIGGPAPEWFMASYRYPPVFYQWMRKTSTRSARKVLPLLAALQPRSVLDVGCGIGAWLEVWRDTGVPEVVGMDGTYVDPQWLRIPRDNFVGADIADSFDLGRRFDLVQSLEVAEHIARDKADEFVRSLVRHGDVVLFAAAQRGQGGEHHVNEQSIDYWHEKFAAQGFVGFDAVRPRVQGDKEVAYWYRFNTVLFVRQERVAEFPWLAQVPRLGKPAARYEPILVRARYAAFAFLPVPLITLISRLNAMLFATALRAGWVKLPGT